MHYIILLIRKVILLHNALRPTSHTIKKSITVQDLTQLPRCFSTIIATSKFGYAKLIEDTMAPLKAGFCYPSYWIIVHCSYNELLLQ